MTTCDLEMPVRTRTVRKKVISNFGLFHKVVVLYCMKTLMEH